MKYFYENTLNPVENINQSLQVINVQKHHILWICVVQIMEPITLK